MPHPYINHFILEFHVNQGSVALIADRIFQDLLTGLGLKTVNSCQHEFDNGGYTKVSILSTSHFSLHTWPENSYLHLDLLTCNPDVTKDKVAEKTNEIIGNYNFDCTFTLREIPYP
jgi:S-adenosylmethionine/arginine decarboxylase-like enzyme